MEGCCVEDDVAVTSVGNAGAPPPVQTSNQSVHAAREFFDSGDDVGQVVEIVSGDEDEV